ncbi:MAG: O-antigen ligase family protein [Patescibacteria group bacterium]
MKKMKLIPFCNKIIAFSFYTLLLLVPLTFNGSTSELFEFNKMWLTFGMSAIILAAWGIKMIAEKKIVIQRTFFDIPLLLFLLSQITATIFSMDQHVSWWGYYSRFNGGLLSSICYIFLYYAFVTNLNKSQTIRAIALTMISAFGVILWGIPSHFGADPTCFVFRGTFDTSCWTEAFKPTIRTFSTLGQPAWLAAYLAALLPVALAYTLSFINGVKWKFALLAGFTVLFYISIVFANTRAGFLSFFAADVVFWGGFLFAKFSPWKKVLVYGLAFHLLLASSSFFFGMPVGSWNSFTLNELTKQQMPVAQTTTSEQKVEIEQQAPLDSISGVNITDSGKIRLLVWQGAIDAWKSSPLFGTGVETFAFAYYKHKPAEHNLTSEWDFLYNKAHNEYLNYLTTTGVFGLLTYLSIIVFFLFQTVLWFIKRIRTKKLLYEDSKDTSLLTANLLILGLVAGFVAILVSNFFGFSVVIINLFFFLFPAWMLILAGKIVAENKLQYVFGEETTKRGSDLNAYQWTAIVILMIFVGSMIIGLTRYWFADISYALGANLNKAGSPQEAYSLLTQATQTETNEPVYSDELSIALATLATALYMQKDATTAQALSKEAIRLSDQVVMKHPNNVVYWKNRVRLFYTLAQGDPQNQQVYLTNALQAIEKAYELAPNDAKIMYNYAVLLGQTGNQEKALELLQKTVTVKPDYRDAYYALGLFYRELAVDDSENVTNPELNQKAIETYQYILEEINPNDAEVKESLATWEDK